MRQAKNQQLRESSKPAMFPRWVPRSMETPIRRLRTEKGGLRYIFIMEQARLLASPCYCPAARKFIPRIVRDTQRYTVHRKRTVMMVSDGAVAGVWRANQRETIDGMDLLTYARERDWYLEIPILERHALRTQVPEPGANAEGGLGL